MLNGISNHQEVSCSNGYTDKCRKNTKTYFLCLLISLRGEKLHKKNSLFHFFLAAHYVRKTYTSKYFLLWTEVLFKDVCCGCQRAVSKELAVSKESSLLPVRLSLVSLSSF